MDNANNTEEANLPLESLGLSSRTLCALRRVGITTVGDVLKMIELGDRIPVFYIPNYGKKSHEELLVRMREQGYLKPR